MEDAATILFYAKANRSKLAPAGSIILLAGRN